MKKLPLHLLAALASAAILAFAFAALAGVSGAPVLETAGWAVSVAVGILVFFLLAFRSSNQRAVSAGGAERERALSFRPPPDKAWVYVARTGFAGSAVGIDIDVDGVDCVQLRSPRFTCVPVAPGTHRFDVRVGQGSAKLLPAPATHAASFAAGSVTALHLRIDRGMLKSALAIEPWSIEEARTRLPKLDMVMPRSPADASAANLAASRPAADARQPGRASL